MGTCGKCNSSGAVISDSIGFCGACIRTHFDELWPDIELVHQQSRRLHGLPERPPRAEDGVTCPLCFHECRIPEGGLGYCGLRRVAQGKLIGGRPGEGNLSYYHDPLPTNCVADFVCPGGSTCGYPAYSVAEGPEYGHRNLAVFYQACSFNCLYCQNFQFKERTRSTQTVSAKELADAVDPKTTCVCYFGGDPSPQVLHAIKASNICLDRADGRVLRICWETNGAMKPPLLQRVADLSMRSGGCVKVDLKAWHDGIHHALCGVTNRQTVENVRMLSNLIPKRHEPPFLIVSTLMVPGYVDEAEVGAIAGFLADLDPDIPYRLLAFYPHYRLTDLPTTSRKHAVLCKESAEAAGLRRVSLGNVHLLGDDYS